MPAAPIAIDVALFADLDAAERGFVLGLLVAQAGHAADIAAVLAPPSGVRCAAAVHAIAALPRSERVRLMGLLAAEALAPIPAGIENVHPRILEDALSPESSETIRLVTAGGPPALRQAGDAVLAARARAGNAKNQIDDGTAVAADVIADLQRAVLATIVAVPPLPPGVDAQRLGTKLLALPPADLLAALTVAGADLLGASLRGADDATLKRAGAHVGAPWSERIARGARTRDNDGDATAAIGREQARLLVAATAPSDNPLQTLERLGARALGDRLRTEDPDLASAVAQRLSAGVGAELLAATAV